MATPHSSATPCTPLVSSWAKNLTVFTTFQGFTLPVGEEEEGGGVEEEEERKVEVQEEQTAERVRSSSLHSTPLWGQ